MCIPSPSFKFFKTSKERSVIAGWVSRQDNTIANIVSFKAIGMTRISNMKQNQKAIYKWYIRRKGKAGNIYYTFLSRRSVLFSSVLRPYATHRKRIQAWYPRWILRKRDSSWKSRVGEIFRWGNWYLSTDRTTAYCWRLHSTHWWYCWSWARCFSSY